MTCNDRDAPRTLPDRLPGYGALHPFGSERPRYALQPPRPDRSGRPALSRSLHEAVRDAGLRDGATLSFHHHLRNGDAVVNAVMAEVAALGLRDIHVAASSIFPVHAPLVRHIQDGVVSGLTTSYLSGPVAEAVGAGLLPKPAVLQTHGGRARAIGEGSLHIDAAFVAAAAADRDGSLGGIGGRADFGPLGYPLPDTAYAAHVVAVTDSLCDRPPPRPAVLPGRVDGLCQVATIGDSAGIVSGTTRGTRAAKPLRIAEMAAHAIEAAGLLRDGLSFQTGAGGISLAVTEALARRMAETGVRGGFASGGITTGLVAMLEAGLLRRLFDVQSFDLEAAGSFARNADHLPLSASSYASPADPDAIVNRLDAVILGAAEVDLGFNVNVTQSGEGRIIGGSGGHSDTAAGAGLAIVTTALNAGPFPKIVERVRTVTTPGDSIDMVVTEAGIAVHPGRPDLRRDLHRAGLRLRNIEELETEARALAGGSRAPGARLGQGAIRAVTEYRDGSVIDVVRA